MINNELFSQKLNQFTNGLSIDPYFYWVNFLKYKKQLFIIPLLIGLMALFVSKNIQPIFQSQAKIIINSNDNNIINIEQVYTESGKANKNNSTFLNTQKEIISSSEIINRIFSSESFYIQANDYLSNIDKTFIKKIYSFFQLSKKNNFNEINLKKYISKNFKVVVGKDSNIITLTFNSQSKEFSKFILDNIINTYLIYDIEQKISVTTYATNKIQERLQELKNNLEISETKLQEYKKENKLIDLGDIKDLKTEEIKSISSRILKAEKELQTLQNDLQQISLASDDIEELSSLKILKEQKEIETVLSNLSSSENTIDSLKLVYKESHPKLDKALKTKKNLEVQLKNIIDSSIASRAYEIANLENFIKLSEIELENSRQELQELEIKDLEMQKFSREVDLNERIYESFLERLKETTEAKELQTPNAAVLDPPSMPINAVSPNIGSITFITYVLTFLILYGVVSYYETFRNAISEPSVLERNGFELINIIPKTPTKKGYHLPINFLEKSSDKFSESISTLSALLTSKFRDSKVFMVTSPVSGEGKTTISLNLALALSTNSNVLFIETDFRRPSLMKSLNLDYRDGLIELFNGKSDYSNIVFNIYSSKLDVISAGRPKNFNKNLDQEKFRNFMGLLKTKYDYIIIDTAPVLPVVDTLLISDVVDTTIFVVRSEYTKFAGLVNAKRKINNVSNSEIVTVLNYFDTDNVNYYNYSNYGAYYKSYYNYS